MLNYLSFARLDMACYELHEHGYDPLKNIADFWGTYSLTTIRAYILASYVKYVDEDVSIDLEFTPGQQVTFLADLQRVLMAYFVVHVRNLDSREISFSTATNEEELKSTKVIFDVYRNLSKLTPNT